MSEENDILEDDDNEEGDGEVLPESEYPTAADVLGEVGHVTESPDDSPAEESGDDPNVGEGEPEEPETPASPLTAEKIRERLNKGGRPRIPEGVMGILMRSSLNEKQISEYVRKHTARLKARLEKLQGEPLQPDQDQTLLMNASLLTAMLRMQEISRVAPEVLADQEWVGKDLAVKLNLQRILKLLGLYAAPKTKVSKRDKPDMNELLRQAKARIRQKGKA